ncbi:MAG: DUF4476 domain-containing protein [Chitinophagaceae bacterium]|nr:DUF4476 domain-containing protein [Chitinophagaceae bacterium]
MKNTFKHAFLTLVVICTCTINIVLAQKKHFIYIQAEDKQPFYIMINQKNYSSSVNGHLVIPKLKNGKYFFIAGFPKDKYPEQKFTCVVEDKDQGFVLKQFGNEGWGLFNLITFKSTLANANEWDKEKSIYDTVKIDDDVTIVPTKKNNTISSENTNQTTAVINKEPVVEVSMASSPKFISAETEKHAADSSTTNPNSVNTLQDQSTVLNATQSKRIVRALQKGSAQGLDEIYIDFTVAPSDTISLFIPFESKSTNTNTAAANTFVIDSSKKNKVGNSLQYNTSCVYLANETDYARTRKSMSLETTDDKMIVIARKTFKGKCYTVEQIKNLGLLFLAEQSRLKFFSVAKPHVYDTLNFNSLETQFSMSSIIEQFRKSNN